MVYYTAAAAASGAEGGLPFPPPQVLPCLPARGLTYCGSHTCLAHLNGQATMSRPS